MRSLPRGHTRVEPGSKLFAVRDRFMKRGTRFAIFAATPLILASFAVFAPAANSQDDSTAAPMVVGDFNLSGSATAGYRFTDVKGYQPQYREMFNLRDGFRLLDLDLLGESQEG